MRTASGYDDEDARTKKDIFIECKEFLRTVIDAESGNRSRGIEALRFRDGDQWPQTLYAERDLDGRLSLTVNHTDTFVSRVENNLKQQRPRIRCHPVGDGADVDKANVINGVIRHIENRSQASVAYDAGGSSALSIGWGYWRIVPEYIDEKSFDQELKILPIFNTFTVYRDPGSILPDGSDSKRYVVSEKIKRTEYKRLYPNATNTSYDPGGLGDEDMEWESRDEIRLAEYFRIIEIPDRLFKMVDGSTVFESEFEAGVLEVALKDPEKHGFAVESRNGKPVAVERKSSRKQVQWFRINGREVIDQRDLPGKFIPIIACQGNLIDINGRKCRSGMIKNLIQPAQMVNYWETMKTEKLALQSKAEWIAYEGVIEGHPEWHDANRKAYSVLIGKAITGPNGEILPLPVRSAPVQIEAGLAEAMQSAYSALMAIAGMPHEPGQDARGEVISGVALEERRDLSDTTHFQYYDNQTVSIAYTGRLLLDLIPYYYDTQRLQRIIGEDGVPQMVELNKPQPPQEGDAAAGMAMAPSGPRPNSGNPAVAAILNDMTVGTYEVVMDTGPGYDTKRQEGSEKLLELLKTPLGEKIAMVGPDLALRGLDTPYADQLADRLAIEVPKELEKMIEGMPERAQNIIKSMAQQTQQLKQQLQAVSDDLKHGLTKNLHDNATKIQIAKMQDDTKVEDLHMETSTKVHDTNTRAHTALAVAEIQAGASLLNTHAEAAHNKEAAEITLKAAEQAETEH